MENLTLIKPEKVQNIINKFCYTIGMIPTSYKMSLTYEEQIIAIGHYLEETVIPALNNNAEAVAELQSLFIQLKDYVENYFDNLDVQVEINNKLDEMAKSGELTQLVTQYLNLNSVLSFENIEEMKQATYLVNGSLCKTFGFHSLNDGGSAYYKIRTVTNTDEIDNITIIPLNIENLVAEFVSLDKILFIKQFGAKEVNEYDNSQIFKKALNYCKENKIEELILNGSFFINNTVVIENLENLVIKNGKIRVHETDELLNTEFNVFNLISPKNVIIDNIDIVEINPVARTRKLQVGGILINHGENCLVQNCYLENTMSGIMLIGNSNNCKILNNTIKVTYQSEQFAQSAILNYASENTTIKNNKIYGEYYDGTLSVYGAGCKNVIVDGNELHNIINGNTPINLSQGITIDSGVKDCICTNNIIYDMFYGIDNKANVENTLISNNILIGCKISIADRDGENVGSGQTFNATIVNNKIIIQKDYETTIGTYMHYGIYYYVGILCHNRAGIKVKNNDIVLYGGITQPVLGIDAFGYFDTNQYEQNHLVTNNNIEFSTGHGATNSNAPSNSTGIVINNCRKGTFTNNTFKVDTVGNIYNMFLFMGTLENILISSNNCRGSNTSNHNFCKLYNESANIYNSKIINNEITLANIPVINNITNIIEYYGEMKAVRGKYVKFSTSWQDVFKIYSQYNYPVIISIELLQSYAGIKYLIGTYRVTINNDNVNFETIEEHKSGIDIQFVAGDTATAKCQLKSDVNMEWSTLLKVTDFIPFSSISQELRNL